MLKKTLGIALALISAVLISACDITVSIDGVIDRVIVTNSSFKTNHVYGTESVVCDDRSTRFEYDVSYRGEIKRIEIYLVGNSSGRKHDIRTLTPRASDNERGSISGSFTVRSEVAPLALGTDEVSTQAIIVNPRPTIIGYTYLVMEIYPERGDRITVLKSGAIPVIDLC